MTYVTKFRALIFLLIGVIAIAVSAGAASAAPYGKTSPRLGVLNPAPCVGGNTGASGRGFVQGESVSVSRDGVPVGTVSANAAGEFSYTVSLTGVAAGDHTIAAVGSVSKIAATTVVAVRSTGCSGAGVAPVAVSTQSTATNPSSTTTASDDLAFTGVQVAALSVFAVVVLVGGAFLVIVGRRRRI